MLQQFYLLLWDILLHFELGLLLLFDACHDGLLLLLVAGVQAAAQDLDGLAPLQKALQQPLL